MVVSDPIGPFDMGNRRTLEAKALFGRSGDKHTPDAGFVWFLRAGVRERQAEESFSCSDLNLAPKEVSSS